jgi:GNAT superfamily N-acetyltransferase
LHTQLFGDDTDFEGEELGNALWLAYDTNRVPVAFATAREARYDRSVMFLSRCGVLPHARGAALQRRLIRARVAWARRRGYITAVTYVLLTNVASATNLLREGFALWRPDGVSAPKPSAWAGDGVMYFRKELGGSRGGAA